MEATKLFLHRLAAKSLLLQDATLLVVARDTEVPPLWHLTFSPQLANKYEEAIFGNVRASLELLAADALMNVATPKATLVQSKDVLQATKRAVGAMRDDTREKGYYKYNGSGRVLISPLREAKLRQDLRGRATCCGDRVLYGDEPLLIFGMILVPAMGLANDMLVLYPAGEPHIALSFEEEETFTVTVSHAVQVGESKAVRAMTNVPFR